MGVGIGTLFDVRSATSQRRSGVEHVGVGLDGQAARSDKCASRIERRAVLVRFTYSFRSKSVAKAGRSAEPSARVLSTSAFNSSKWRRRHDPDEISAFGSWRYRWRDRLVTALFPRLRWP
jgi:hypothetical protein